MLLALWVVAGCALSWQCVKVRFELTMCQSALCLQESATSTTCTAVAKQLFLCKFLKQKMMLFWNRTHRTSESVQLCHVVVTLCGVIMMRLQALIMSQWSWHPVKLSSDQWNTQLRAASHWRVELTLCHLKIQLNAQQLFVINHSWWVHFNGRKVRFARTSPVRAVHFRMEMATKCAGENGEARFGAKKKN